MSVLRKVEVFSAGCPACEATIQLVENLACDSCTVSVLDMRDPETARRARTLSINSVPAVAIDGKLAGCCTGEGPDVDTLLAGGLGSPLA